MKETVLPVNFDAELIVLGSMLSSIDHVNVAIDKLQSHDFSDYRHQKIFDSMRKLYLNDSVIEPETVHHEIEPLEPANLAYLYELIQYNASYDIDSFVEKIKDKSKLRRFIFLNKSSMEEACDPKANPDNFISDYSKKLDSIFTELGEKSLKNPHQIFDNYQDSNLSFLKFIEDRQERKKRGESILRGTSTGYRKLDEYLSGFCPGHMVVVAARPGVGKSTFVLNIMRKMLTESIPILFFSMEMTADEVIGKLVSMESGVSYKAFEEGLITGEDYQKIVPAYHSIKEFPLWIEDQEDLTPTQIRTRSRRNIEAHGIQAVFIDYLTCISPERRTNSREEGVRDISSSIRKMAKGFKVPFITVAQENRDSEKGDGKQRAPKKSDLGQSGGIEQDAHSIIMLRRPEMNDPFDKPGIIQAHIVKNRFGAIGHIDFPFTANIGFMDEFEERPQF